MSRKSNSTSNNPPSIDFAEKSTNCSTSTCLTSISTSKVFFSTCFFSLVSPIILTIGVGGEKCLQRFCNVFSNPFPPMGAHCRALKISRSTFLSSPKLSLLSQDTGGDLDASDSKYHPDDFKNFLFNSLQLFFLFF
jgi:hypothetical protein